MQLPRLLWLLGLIAASSCNRAEERPHAQLVSAADDPQPASSSVLSSEPTRTGPAPAPSCLVPTRDTPPPAVSAAARCPAAPAPLPELDRGYVTFPDAAGAPRISVELASSPEVREQGLMYRTRLSSDEGMLFSWNNDAVRSFWMRNTCIPLDMLFITGDSLIVGILENVPTLNDASRTIQCPARHVLEVNAGWSRSHGVKAGQKLRIER